MNVVGKFEYISKEMVEKTLSQENLNQDLEGYRTQLFDLPRRATKGSAGYDVRSPFAFVLKAGETIKLPLGFKVKIEEGWCLKFYPRSGLGTKYKIRLSNTVGIGDSDYYNNSGNEGQYFIFLENHGDKDLSISFNDKICQCIFEQYGITVDDIPVSESRVGGFGSTGTK